MAMRLQREQGHLLNNVVSLLREIYQMLLPHWVLFNKFKLQLVIMKQKPKVRGMKQKTEN